VCLSDRLLIGRLPFGSVLSRPRERESAVLIIAVSFLHILGLSYVLFNYPVPAIYQIAAHNYAGHWWAVPFQRLILSKLFEG
jgi:hypothetical protein